jgi:hypothetical protein
MPRWFRFALISDMLHRVFVTASKVTADCVSLVLTRMLFTIGPVLPAIVGDVALSRQRSPGP